MICPVATLLSAVAARHRTLQSKPPGCVHSAGEACVRGGRVYTPTPSCICDPLTALASEGIAIRSPRVVDGVDYIVRISGLLARLERAGSHVTIAV